MTAAEVKILRVKRLQWLDFWIDKAICCPLPLIFSRTLLGIGFVEGFSLWLLGIFFSITCVQFLCLNVIQAVSSKIETEK